MHHHDCVVARRLAQNRRRRVAQFRARIIKPIVDFIGEKPQVVAPREIENALLLFFGGHPAERIGRRRIKDEARVGSDRALERVEIDAVAITAKRVGQLNHLRVIHHRVRAAVGPRRRERDGLRSWVKHRADAQVQSLHSRSRNDDLARRIEFHVLQPAIIIGERAPQRGKAGVLGVVGEAVVHGADRGLLDVIGRRHIGFTEVKAQHAIHTHGDFRQLADAGMRDTSTESAIEGICLFSHRAS